jgi:hypothetical protein
MSAAERLAEVSRILAAALVRSRARAIRKRRRRSGLRENGLDPSGDASAHDRETSRNGDRT